MGAARLGEGVDLDRHAQAGAGGSSSRSSRVASGSRAVRSRVSEAASISARGRWWTVSGIGGLRARFGFGPSMHRAGGVAGGGVKAGGGGARDGRAGAAGREFQLACA